jgi:hypothetical protein
MIELLEQEERPAYVRFERKAVELKAESLKQGRTVYQDVDWVFVSIPYSRDVFEDKAVNWIEKQKQKAKSGRVPQKFVDYWIDCYDKWKVGQEPPTNGTDIRNWSAVSPAEIKTMQSVGIRTIEDMALCNAEGLNRIGMGARKLKNLAEAWIKGADDRGAIVMENAELKKQLEIANKDVELLNQKVATLKYQLENSNKEPTHEAYVESTSIEVGDILDESPIKDQVLGHETLVQQYIEKFGKKPHHLMKDETIRAKLEE